MLYPYEYLCRCDEAFVLLPTLYRVVIPLCSWVLNDSCFMCIRRFYCGVMVVFWCCEMSFICFRNYTLKEAILLLLEIIYHLSKCT